MQERSQSAGLENGLFGRGLLTAVEGLCFAAAAAAVLWLAVTAFSLSARFTDLTLVAERIETGQAASPALVKRLAGIADQLPVEGICRSDIVLSGATLELRRLDDTPQTDYEAWWQVLTATARYLRHAIGCAPFDSNLWLRYAVIDGLIAEEPGRIAHVLGLAAQLGPANEIDIIARLGFLNFFRPETLEAAQDVVRRDVALALEKATGKNIAEALPFVSPALKPYIAEAALRLSAERMADLRYWGADLDRLLK